MLKIIVPCWIDYICSKLSNRIKINQTFALYVMKEILKTFLEFTANSKHTQSVYAYLSSDTFYKCKNK